MQSVHNSFSVKTFSLAAAAAGGDSGSKKTRNRRSKEERKTMVESFIKKYQNTNNGKYPSLNLTHKEVGGSFYTVREIVREIIQENRVLAPGNLNSKALNLAYYPEEEDISTPLSIATIDYTTDREQGDGVSFRDSGYVNPADSEIFEVDSNSVHLASCEESEPNITIVSQQVDGENSEYLESDMDYDAIDEESNLTNESEVVINENPESIAAQISGNVMSSVPSCESMVNVIIDTGNQRNINAPIINSLSASNGFLPILDKLPETNLSIESVSDGSSVEIPTVSDIDDEVKEEFVPFGVDSVNNKIFATEKTVISSVGNGVAAACPGAQISLEQDSVVNLDMSENFEDSKYSSEQVSENIDHLAPSFDALVDFINDNGGDGINAMATEISSSSSSDLALTSATSSGNSMPSKSVLDASASLEDRKTCYFVDVKEALIPPGVDSTIYNISENVLISSNLGDETLAACHGTQHSHKLDPFAENEAENTETSSTIVIDEPSSENLNLPELLSFESKELESMGSVVPPLSHANNLRNAVTKSSDEASQHKNKVEKQNRLNSGCVTNTKSIPRQSLPRQSLDMEAEKTTENPFWAAIKSIINAVSKFLTE